ncbi:phenylalanine--tRNA ligase subunit beta [Jonquetella sp. BV3C21]|uniref:phenylalanine--tRNA ligase subunit beta n=1 Tax=Jonquetella sp. BV3C21 TaxID=1111126 RepID=UPI0003AE3444|nr:phenylalanine--tRNA ligase subunit beta [Jonquetella sp. BV3C21]ERL24353.1 phenylalanine--tRNA ligase, beta subunit [Jonquetella sp. BV3C21]
MLLSWNWLQQFVSIPAPIDQVADRLTVTGSEVESLTQVSPKVSGLRIAKVLETKVHPTKSGLTVTTLDLGNGERRPCVTAAKNVTAGCIVSYAPSGSTIADGMTLGFRDFDGFTSDGMMVSAAELGLPELSPVHGILLLPDDAPIGADLKTWLGLDDWVIDLSITPNRGDMLSYLGTAREIAALIPGASLHLPELRPALQQPGDWSVQFNGVTLEGDGCMAYRLGAADSVKVAASPLEWGVRLCLSGMRPVNNVVDATNIAMLALGQPLHAFDAASLPAPEITVRPARPGETMMSLDHKERVLSDGDLVISSGGVAVGLAGVMGGQNSEVTESTGAVLIESACFSAPAISRTSRRLGIPSEAAFRYARGVDPCLTELSLSWVKALLSQWGAARVYEKEIFCQKKPFEPRRVFLTERKTALLTAQPDLAKTGKETLTRLGLVASAESAEGTEYVVPSWRNDLSIEEDLIEEVARIHGYQDSRPRIPELYGPGQLGEFMSLHRQIREAAMARGYSEAITYSFISPDWLQKIDYPEIDSCKTLTNPISADLSVMRPTILPSLLAAVSKAEKRGWRDEIRLFECGKAFVPSPDGTVEFDRLCGVVYAGAERRRLYGARTAEDFFSVKADLMALLVSRGIRGTFIPASLPWGHAGQTAQVLLDGKPAGYLAQLKPSISSAWDLSAPLFFFEIDLAPLARPFKPCYKQSGDFPPVYRDIALLADRGASSEAIASEILELGKPVLRSVKLFDLYCGQGIPEDKKSLAFSMAYRLDDRTMTDAEVESRHSALRQALEKKGYVLR